MKKRLKTEELRGLERDGDRCEAKHPNWYDVRCELPSTLDHDIHYGQERMYVWFDE